MQNQSKYTAGAIAAASAAAMYALAAGIELAVINIVQPTETALAGTSDAVLAVAFGLAVFLWLHLKSTRSALSRLEREHVVLDTELALAADIQRSLLPAVTVADGVRWAARLKQAGPIGGDLYDLIRVSKGVWLLLVGDVSGKGIPAAMVLASIRTMFRISVEQTTDPAELVARMSHRLFQDHNGKPYLTCIVVRVDVERGEIAYVNAGHPPGLILGGAHDAKRPCLLDSSGPPAGLSGANVRDANQAAAERQHDLAGDRRHHRCVAGAWPSGAGRDRGDRVRASGAGAGSCV